MKYKILAIALLILPFQINAQSITKQSSLRSINNLWAKFYQAFETSDIQPFKQIHSKRLVRISGGKRLSDYKSYISGQTKRFKKARKQATSYQIELRFFERVADEKMASERGIYKLTVKRKDKETADYYGQFHVVLIKKKGTWKILVDYDSDEGDSIGIEQFNKAYSIDNLAPFIVESG